MKLEAYFQSETNVYLRLGYVSAQLYEFYKLADFLVPYVDRCSLASWGDIYDLLFCAAFVSLQNY